MRTGTALPVCLANLFSKKSLLEIGMTNKQSEAYTKKFEKIMENKMKVINKYNINLEVYLRVSNVKIQMLLEIYCVTVCTEMNAASDFVFF